MYDFRISVIRAARVLFVCGKTDFVIIILSADSTDGRKPVAAHFAFFYRKRIAVHCDCAVVMKFHFLQGIPFCFIICGKIAQPLCVLPVPHHAE